MDEPLPTGAITWSRLEVRGDEALSFLDGQLTQDLSGLDGEGRATLLLQPDSVVVAAGVVRAAGDGADLLVPRALAEASLRRLRRFLLRVNCEIRDAGEAEGPLRSGEEMIDDGWPGPAELSRSLTPHALGERNVARMVSFTKGCYTGQELVGRLDARGAPVPWRLVRVTGASPQLLDDALRSVGPEGPSGLTTWVATAEGVRGLGVAHRSLLTRELEGLGSLEAL